MSKSTALLHNLLATLTARARAAGLNDAEWSRRAGLRKETLSRLRGRETCDFETLRSLAEAVGASIGISESVRPEKDHFPSEVDRDYEERLAALCASGDLSRAHWAALGPCFFMAGLAVMLAGVEGHDRRGLITLSEQLHPGASEPEVFKRWLARSPVRPSRFLPLVESLSKHAA